MEKNIYDLAQWKTFINDNIVRLKVLSDELCRVFDDIEKCNDKPYSDASELLKEALVMGLNENGEYSENAFALFLRDVLGVGLDDTKRFVREAKENLKISTKVVIYYRTFSFMRFTRIINENTDLIIRKAEEKGISINIDDVIAKDSVNRPEDLAECIRMFLECAINTCINRNPFTLFAWTLRKITPKYLKKAYPDIDKDLLYFLGFKKIKSFGKEYELYGFEDYFTKYYREYRFRSLEDKGDIICVNGVPTYELNILNIAWAYTYKECYGKPHSIGGALCRLNEAVFTYLRTNFDYLSKWFKGIVDEEENYIERIHRTLEELNWSEPEFIEGLYASIDQLRKGHLIYRDSRYRSPFRFLIIENDGFIKKYIQWRYPKTGGFALSRFEQDSLREYFTVFQLIDRLSSAIFLGLFDMAFNGNELLLVKRG